MYFDEGGEGCIGILQLVDVNKQIVGERSNNVYVLGVFLVFFAFSSRGVGRLKKLAKSTQNQKGIYILLRASNLLQDG